MLFAYTRVFNSRTFLWDTNDKLYLTARTNITLCYTVPCVLPWFPGKVPPSRTTHSRRTHTKPSPRKDPRGLVNIKIGQKINVLVESCERDSMISY